jgi:hypothetical protein
MVGARPSGPCQRRAPCALAGNFSLPNKNAPLMRGILVVVDSRIVEPACQGALGGWSLSLGGYFVPETSISTRRSGCRQAISAGVGLAPLQSPGFVTGSAPSTPLAEILAAAMPPDCTR